MAEPTWLHGYVLDPAERAVSTFVQQFVVVLTVAGGSGAALLITQNWLVAVDTAGFAAIASVVTSVATFAVPKLPTGFDILFRTLKTFAQSLGGVLATDQFTSVVHTDWKGAIAVAIPTAITALLKSLAALAAPWSDGASLLPVTDKLYVHPAVVSHPDITPTPAPVPASPAADPVIPAAEPPAPDPTWDALDSAKASSPPAPHLGGQHRVNP